MTRKTRVPEKMAVATTGKKVFVLDTNVILHDGACLLNFAEHDVVIPITVVEELDGFKRGSETINANAREFLRTLKELTGSSKFNGGVSIGVGKGLVSVELEGRWDKNISANFSPGKPDHRILNTAYCIFKKRVNDRVILVTKDVNLQIKAKAVGLPVEDYTSDNVKNVAELYRGMRLVEDLPADYISLLYKKPFQAPIPECLVGKEIFPNEYFILRNGSQSAMGVYDSKLGVLRRVEKMESCAGIKPKNVEQSFALDALLNPDVSLVTLTGKAGTGKTLMALSAALENRRDYRQIFLARPIVPLSNKDIGFLPGDIKSKLDPYMQPLFDNLSVIDTRETESAGKKISGRELLETEKIVIAPLAYIRGRSLVKVFFIVDEAQNLTPHEIKTIVTRAGEGTKVVFTGDIFQIDHPYLDTRSNGLSYLIDRMKGQSLYAHINLEKGERSVLSELASQLL